MNRRSSRKRPCAPPDRKLMAAPAQKKLICIPTIYSVSHDRKAEYVFFLANLGPKIPRRHPIQMMSNVSRFIQQHCLQAIDSEWETQASFHLWPFQEGASESCIIVKGRPLSENETCYREHMQIWVLRNKWNDSEDIAWGIMCISFICTALTASFFPLEIHLMKIQKLIST